MVLKKNKRGQSVIVLLMIAIVMIILVLAISPLLKQIGDESRNPTNLDCSNETISNFNKVTCIASDMNLFYYIGGMIFLAGSIATAKLLSR